MSDDVTSIPVLYQEVDQVQRGVIRCAHREVQRCLPGLLQGAVTDSGERESPSGTVLKLSLPLPSTALSISYPLHLSLCLPPSSLVLYPYLSLLAFDQATVNKMAASVNGLRHAAVSCNVVKYLYMKEGE